MKSAPEPLTKPGTDTSPDLLPEAAGNRLAMLAVAAPVVCCAVGLLMVILLKHRQAMLAARYAALDMLALGLEPSVEPPSFLHLASPAREILARNPGQWSSIIAITSFVVTPIVLVGVTAFLYGLRHRNRTAMFAGAVPVAVLAWMSYAPLRMVLAGRVVVLDGARDSLELNGTRIVALSDVAGFAGQVVHGSRGASEFLLSAVLRNGRNIRLQGPDARADMVPAGDAMTAMLHRVRHDPPPAPLSVTPGCAASGCVSLTPQQMQEITARTGSVFGIPGPSPTAATPTDRVP